MLGKNRDSVTWSDEARYKMRAQIMAKTGSNKCVKILCPAEVTAGVIGHNGSKMKAMETENGATIRVSKKNETFPGAENERVIDIMGSLSALKECVNTVQMQIRGHAPASRQNFCIIIVSDDAAGKMMGKGGAGTKKLANKWTTKINASDRKAMNWTLMERSIAVFGKPKNVEGCINDIITMSVEPEIKPMTHGLCYEGITSTGYTGIARDKIAAPLASKPAAPSTSSSKPAAPSASKIAAPLASKPAAPLASKPVVPSASNFNSSSKSEYNPHFHKSSVSKSVEAPNKPSSKFFDRYSPNYHAHGFKTSAKDQPSGLTASAQNKLNPYKVPYKPGSYDSKGKPKVTKDEEGWETVTRQNSTGEAASPPRLGELETSPDTSPSLATEEGYFDLTGYSVYNIINLGDGLPVKKVLVKDF